MTRISLSCAIRPNEMTPAIRLPSGAHIETTNGRESTITSPTFTTGTPLRTSMSASRNSRSISRTNVRMTMARKNGGTNCFSA